MAIPHDRLFKELLSSFIHEFIELFLPDLAELLQPATLVPLDKEAFPKLGAGKRREGDLVYRARMREGEDVYFLIHLEHQAESRSNFPRRMFRYFFLFHDKHKLPVYPIALLSHQGSRRKAASSYRVGFPNFEPLRFQYKTIQLNRLSWRDYLHSSNPVAAALMSRMRIEPKDRPQVKLACLRQLRKLNVGMSRMLMISNFVDNYLDLDAKEEAQFRAELDTIEPEEQETIMRITNSWKEEGRTEGRVEGQIEALKTVLEARFGTLPERLKDRLGDVSSAFEKLVAKAATTSSLEAFARELEHEDGQLQPLPEGSEASASGLESTGSNP